MTEKRFTLISDDGLQYYDFIEDNGKVIHTSKVVDLLNQFNDENNQYKILIKSLKEQNQKLKLRLKDLGVEYF